MERDRANAPDLLDVREDFSTDTPEVVTDDAESIVGFVEPNSFQEVDAGVYATRVNLLVDAKNAARDSLTFSWKNSSSSPQVGYTIDVYERADSSSPLVSSGVVLSTQQTAVSVPSVAGVLEDNQLYNWTITSTHADGSAATSERSSFVTEVGDEWMSTAFIWTPDQSVANLMRADVDFPANVEKAMLSVTALDTEGARWHERSCVQLGTGYQTNGSQED